MNTNDEIPTNGVDEMVTQCSQLLLSNGPVVDQASRGYDPATGTTSKKYTKKVTELLVLLPKQSRKPWL